MQRKLAQPFAAARIDWKKYKEELGGGYSSGLSMDDLDDRNLIRVIQPLVGTYMLFSDDVKFSSLEKVTLAAADLAKRNRLEPSSILFVDSLVRAWCEFRARASRAVSDFVRGKSTLPEVIDEAVSPAREILGYDKLAN